MGECAFCPEPLDADSPETYRQVVSWVHGPKLDGPKLREQTGLLAHKKCIDHLVHGQAADQPELFDEAPLITDEPGHVYKLTGPNSLHTALQSRRNAEFFADVGPCIHCGTPIDQCSSMSSAFVCCSRCEHKKKVQE